MADGDYQCVEAEKVLKDWEKILRKDPNAKHKCGFELGDMCPVLRALRFIKLSVPRDQDCQNRLALAYYDGLSNNGEMARQTLDLLVKGRFPIERRAQEYFTWLEKGEGEKPQMPFSMVGGVWYEFGVSEVGKDRRALVLKVVRGRCSSSWE